MLAYIVAGVQYARLTPAWQAPDEPAHFNYVKYVAEHRALPELQLGDFPADYLARFTNPAKTPGMSIAPIRYESWQPPLYYLLAAGVYGATTGLPQAGQLLALRLFSVALGALLILAAYRAAAAFLPGRPWLALGAAAFLAALPMHVATTAAVSNDTLAELWVALALCQIAALLRQPDGGGEAFGQSARSGRGGFRPYASPLLLGVTLGLAALTKLNTAIVLPPALIALASVAWRRDGSARLRGIARRLGALCLPPLLLLAPWLARNVAVYGLADPLASRQHQAVVVGQQRTADWIAQNGLRFAASDFVTTTCHSFWGQFGWMGVVLDERIYRGLTVLTALALVGLALRARRLRHEWKSLPEAERLGLGLLALLAALSAAGLLWYNLTFLQRQGRYLFLALVPIGIALAAGWREMARRARRPLAAGLLAALAVLLAAWAALRRAPLDKYTLAGLVGGSGGFGLAAWLPEPWALWLYALPYLLLLGLDFVCLYAFIVPGLSG